MSRLFLFTSILVLIAILAPFFFPWPFAFAAGILASAFFPPAIFLTGLLIDLLYVGSHTLPYFTISGLILAVIAYFVQQFVKTRIMS